MQLSFVTYSHDFITCQFYYLLALLEQKGGARIVSQVCSIDFKYLVNIFHFSVFRKNFNVCLLTSDVIKTVMTIEKR